MFHDVQLFTAKIDSNFDVHETGDLKPVFAVILCIIYEILIFNLNLVMWKTWYSSRHLSHIFYASVSCKIISQWCLWLTTYFTSIRVILEHSIENPVQSASRMLTRHRQDREAIFEFGGMSFYIFIYSFLKNIFKKCEEWYTHIH